MFYSLFYSLILKIPYNSIYLVKARSAKTQKLEPSIATDESCDQHSISGDHPSNSAGFELSTSIEQPITSDQSSTDNLSTSFLDSCDLSEETMKEYLWYHVKDCARSLCRDNLMSLAMTLHLTLAVENGVTHTDVVKVISSVIGNNERTVREWKYTFFKNSGSFPDSQ